MYTIDIILVQLLKALTFILNTKFIELGDLTILLNHISIKQENYDDSRW